MKGFRSLSLSFALTFLIASAVSADTPPPAIASIDPSSATPAGGVKVAINGTNLDLPPNFACFAPCPTRVWFGESEASVKEFSNERLLVIAPPHAPGAVDVTVTSGDGRTGIAAKAFTYTQTAESAYVMVLLPIYLDAVAPGANGSRWQTDLWIRNNGLAPAAIAPWPCPIGAACPAIFPLTYTLKSGESVHNLPVGQRPPTPSPARLVYVTRSAAADVAFNLRVFDVSRASVNGGTELPVVRENQFLTRTANILNVPLSEKFRRNLRIFDMREAPDNTLASSAFRVRIYSQQEGTGGMLLAERTVTAVSSQSGMFRDTPLFGQIGDLTEGIFGIENAGPLRVEIEPLAEGSRYWAVVSVTNNETQQITLVTPQ